MNKAELERRTTAFVASIGNPDERRWLRQGFGDLLAIFTGIGNIVKSRTS
jgi:hypothetical protein